MTASINFDQGANPAYGSGLGECLGDISWDAACTAAGDVVDMSENFSTIHGVEVLGVSATGMTGYVPQFFFATGAPAADGATLRMMVQDGAAGLLEGTTDDLTSVGTLRVRVRGLLAVS